jgi:hypothetical protein
VCFEAIAAVTRSVTEGMWADGWTSREIADVFGHATLAWVPVMRRRGWDLPYRRTPEQVARIRAGSRAAQGLAA